MILLQAKPNIDIDIDTPQTQHIYSLDEYYALEENSDVRHEFCNGEIEEMTGGTINHNRIIRNLVRILDLAFQNTNREVFTSDLRLYIPEFKKATYPDIMVIEGKIMLHNNRQDEVLNPCLIIEILSPSTANYDRKDKFYYYRSIPTLKQYILISQFDYTIESYTKTGENKWLFEETKGENIEVNLESIELSFPISDLYIDVKF
ncbi:Uma2 family endonuclease [Geminocystis herdmanii]|uniref:Uma2 family endonuclease n=1 Tax=Geminocystis herdmanii TaxID=669359 RepID=UPI00034954CB|nr:Uma2 family endonuclease [Geminocystis herdmanii]